MFHLVVRAVPRRDTAAGPERNSIKNKDVDGEEKGRILKEVLHDVWRITSAESDYSLNDPGELARRIVHTSHILCCSASLSETHLHSRAVADDVG